MDMTERKQKERQLIITTVLALVIFAAGLFFLPILAEKILLGVVLVLIAGGLFYGRLCERVFRPGDRRTPAYARADGVDFVGASLKQLKKLEEIGCDGMPVCMAKTQYSFTDDQKVLGAPDGFRISVRNVKVSAGAGFIIALTGDIMTMPGLPKVPAAERIDVDENGVISGLF